MGIPKTYNTQAIVLKRADLGEADSLITLYTPHLGKLRAVARGARRPKSKLGGHVEPFTHCEAQLAHSNSLDVITQCQTIESFVPLRGDLRRSSCAMYAVELVDRFTADEQENYGVFGVLLDFLRWLCQAHNDEALLRAFELHALDYLGYRPQLQECISCEEALAPGMNFFSPGAGGVLCRQCRSGNPDAVAISTNALKSMRFLQHSDYAEACRLQLPSALAQEVEHLMRRYIHHVLERDVRSAEWVSNLKNWA